MCFQRWRFFFTFTPVFSLWLCFCVLLSCLRLQHAPQQQQLFHNRWQEPRRRRGKARKYEEVGHQHIQGSVFFFVFFFFDYKKWTEEELCWLVPHRWCPCCSSVQNKWSPSASAGVPGPWTWSWRPRSRCCETLGGNMRTCWGWPERWPTTSTTWCRRSTRWVTPLLTWVRNHQNCGWDPLEDIRWGRGVF